MSDERLWYVTSSTYARHNGVTVRAVHRWIEEGKVDAVKSPQGYRWRILIKKSSAETATKADKGP